MKMFVAALLLSLLSGIAHADPVKDLWPKGPFKQVVAYCYDPSQDDRGNAITFADGSLHKGVIGSVTVKLDEARTLKLRTILGTDTGKNLEEKRCYEPHHAFVFYDEDGKAASSIDVCFLCNNYGSRPEKAAESIDLEALKKFCGEVGLPVLKESGDYTKLFRKEHEAGVKKDHAKKGGTGQDSPTPPSKP